jgi:hypothetical protein
MTRGFPVNLRGINDEDEFRAVVSCLTNGPHQGRGRGHGLVETRNIFTDGFAATRTGDSTIDTFVTLPIPASRRSSLSLPVPRINGSPSPAPTRRR